MPKVARRIIERQSTRFALDRFFTGAKRIPSEDINTLHKLIDVLRSPVDKKRRFLVIKKSTRTNFFFFFTLKNAYLTIALAATIPETFESPTPII